MSIFTKRQQDVSWMFWGAWILGFFCQCYVRNTVEKVDLSVHTLHEYNLRAEELSQLQYYLSDELRLTGKNKSIDKSITRNLQLYVDRDDDAVTLIFRKGLPGVGVHAWKDYKLKIGDHRFFGGPVRLKVCFDRLTNNCLTFVPNDTGKYVLDLDERGWVYFGGQRYKCPPEYRNVGLYFEVIDSAEKYREEREIQDRKVIKRSY